MNRFFMTLILILHVGSLFPCDFFTRDRDVDICSDDVPSFVPNDTTPPLSNHELPKTYLTFPLDMSQYIVGATLAVARNQAGRGKPYPYDIPVNIDWKEPKNKDKMKLLSIKALSNMAEIVGATLAVASKGETTKNIFNNITIFMLWRQHPF